MKRKSIGLLVGLLALALAACGWQPGGEPETEPPVEELSMVVTAENIMELEQYPELKRVDLSGSTCYAEIQTYARNHPEVDVIYTVRLGSRGAIPGTKKLTLHPGDFDLETLTGNLGYLEGLEEVVFADLGISMEELDALRGQFPQITFRYQVPMGDEMLDPEVCDSLNLSWAAPEDVAEIVRHLPLLPNLVSVELMDGDASALDLADVAAIQEAVPQATVHYTFDLFGQTVSTTDEEIVLEEREPGDSGEETLRQALKVLRASRVVLDRCGFDNDFLAGLREEYREHGKLVWRIWFGKKGSCLTDREVIRAVYGLTDENCQDLKYCEDALYCDFGHDDELTDASFVAGMPKLKAIILSGSLVADLTPFTVCKDLEFLELAYCGKLKDLSPLAECESLTRLNVAFTNVGDLSPLDELSMEVLTAMGAKVRDQERTRFKEVHPDCQTAFTGRQPYGKPWRYIDNGYTFNEYYAMLREVFDYDHAKNTTW